MKTGMARQRSFHSMMIRPDASCWNGPEYRPPSAAEGETETISEIRINTS